MPKVGVVGDGVDVSPFTDSPAEVSEGQTFFTVNDESVLLHGYTVASHSQGSTHHTSQTLVASQDFFSVNGVAVAMDGDAATCGHQGLQASGFMTITPKE